MNIPPELLDRIEALAAANRHMVCAISSLGMASSECREANLPLSIDESISQLQAFHRGLAASLHEAISQVPADQHEKLFFHLNQQ